MRIGMILDKIFPPDPRVENEAIELIKNGHEVFLFCLSYKKNELKEEEINKIEIKRYKTNNIEYKLSAFVYTIPIYSFLMKQKIGHFLNKFNIEAIHIHDMVIAEAVFKANKKKIPMVLDLHENRPEIMRFYPHLKKFPATILISLKKWKKKEEELIHKTDKLILVTEQAKADVLERTLIDKTKVVIVPNTVREKFYLDAEKVIEVDKKNRFNLLYIGDTGDRRGLYTVIKSLLTLSELIPSIKLIIVGKSNPKLEKTVRELRLEKYVNFEGWQKECTFQKYIINSDICLSPLHRNIHHDTTYANKLFQYMSLGKPLLVSNATAQSSLIKQKNSGLVHKEKNVKDFTDKVLELYFNKNLRKKLGDNGKKFVREQFTWSKTSKGLINLYNNLH